MIEKEKLAGLVNKKSPNPVGIIEEENRKIVDKVVDKNVVDKKSLNLISC